MTRRTRQFYVSPMDISVRNATAGDRETIAELLVQTDLAQDESVCERVATCLERHRETCFVAERQSQIVGVLLASFNGFHIFLSHIAVTPDLRRGGIGTMLHERLLASAAKLHARAIIVDSRLTSTPFFHALGYRTPGAVFLIRGL